MKQASAPPKLHEQLRRAPAKPDARQAYLADLDTQLMLQVREGNVEAANLLVSRNAERVSRYIARIVRHPRAVEDLTQDVFLHVLKGAKRYEPTAKVSTWLYRIATNVAQNYLAQAYVKRQRASEGQDAEIADRTEATPDRRMSLDELRDRVSAAIGGLPVNQRIALTLFEYEGLSYEQIATVLDSTVDAVRCMLRRAREALRAELRGLV